jgi:hypothetical protein
MVVHDFTTNDATMTDDPSGLRSTTIALGMITTSKVDRYRHIGTNPRKRKCLLRYEPGQYGSASSGSGWRIMHQHQQWSMVPRETEHVKKTRQCGDGGNRSNQPDLSIKTKSMHYKLPSKAQLLKTLP